jgi:hypothetical protein
MIKKMILNYETGKLPPNFIALGAMLVVIGIWRLIVLDWIGIMLFAIGIVLFFIKSGVIIDTESKRLKKYFGFFGIMKGEWEDFKSLNYIQIFKIKAIQSMSVLSISRTEIKEVYKLLMILPDKSIEIMSGEKDYVTKVVKEVSSILQTKVFN